MNKKNMSDQQQQQQPPAEARRQRNDNDDALCWRRIIAVRVDECERLPYQVVRSLLEDYPAQHDIGEILRSHVRIFTSGTALAADRRQAFYAVQDLFERMDQAKEQRSGAASLTPARSIAAVDEYAKDAKGRNRTPSENDVLAGITPQMPDYDHPGNVQYRELIRQYAPKFTGTKNKVAIIRKINAKVEDMGGRFLERDSSGEQWIELDEKRAEVKTTNAIRAQVTKMDKEPKTDHDKDANGCIRTPNENDVLAGITPNMPDYDHPGNVQYRALIQKHAASFAEATNRKDLIRNLNAEVGGRFLERDSTGEMWVELEEKRAETKTDNALRFENKKRSKERCEDESGSDSSSIVVPPKKGSGANKRADRIDLAGENDVLVGKDTYNHVGNIQYRELIRQYAPEYVQATNGVDVARKVNARIAALGGRFLLLEQSGKSEYWTELYEKKAETKTANALRYEGSKTSNQDNAGKEPPAASLTEEEGKSIKKLRTTGRIRTPALHDVLAGVGKDVFSHPGNAQYRAFVTELLPDWIRGYPTKRDVERRVNAKVSALGGRFLERDKKAPEFWVLLDEERSIVKTFQSFRREARKVQPGVDADDDEASVSASAESEDDAASQSSSAGRIESPGALDVIGGNSMASREHEGNKQFRNLIRDHAAEYADSEAKNEVIRKVIAKVSELGGRFIERRKSSAEESWVEIEPARAERKVRVELLRCKDHIVQQQEKCAEEDARRAPGKAAPRTTESNQQLESRETHVRNGTNEDSPSEASLVATGEESSTKSIPQHSSLLKSFPTSASNVKKQTSDQGPPAITASIANGSVNAVAKAVPAEQGRCLPSPSPFGTNAAEQQSRIVSVEAPRGAQQIAPTSSTTKKMKEVARTSVSETEKLGHRHKVGTVISQSEVTEKDVLLDQGDVPWEGNAFFAEQLRLLSEEYDFRNQALLIATVTIDRVARNGGRFLRAVGETTGPGKIWVELDRQSMIEAIQRKVESTAAAAGAKEKARKPVEQEQPVLFKCNEHDVLIGDRTVVASWPGNVYFQRLVGHYINKNPSSAPQDESTRKDIIARQAIQDVVANGGCFLRTHPENFGPQCLREKIWTKVEAGAVLEKVCAAIPDAVSRQTMTDDLALSNHAQRTPTESATINEWRSPHAAAASTASKESPWGSPLVNTLKGAVAVLPGQIFPPAAKRDEPENKSPLKSLLERGRRREQEDQIRKVPSTSFKEKLISERRPSFEGDAVLSHQPMVNKRSAPTRCHSLEDNISPIRRLSIKAMSVASRNSSSAQRQLVARSVDSWNLMASVRGSKANTEGPQQEQHSITIMALPDRVPTFGCTQVERAATRVTFVPSSMLDVALAEQVGHRLKEWDPFWETVSFVGIGVTTKVDSTSPKTDLIKTAAVFNLSFPLSSSEDLSIPDSQWGKPRGDGGWSHGDTVLLLRMLPVDSQAYKKKRADCHLWPKGTFLQINGKKIHITQRKQQAHNLKEWKSLCCELDITEHIVDPKLRNTIQFFCYDDQPYLFVFSLCKYRSVDQLYKSLTMPGGGEEAITILSREACFDKALHFASQQMTITIDGDDEGEEDGEEGKFVYSLCCPVSKTLMTMPVRGRNCKHFQCFDLRSYLSSNAFVSGSRWRCASCENFVSLPNLEVCGLTVHLLREFAAAASTERDRVELRTDRSYTLLAARKRLTKSKKRDRDIVSLAEDEDGNSRPAKSPKNSSSSSREVIDLL